MKIENVELDSDIHYLNPVTYVPNHVQGNAGHPDCEQGVIIYVDNINNTLKILYCKSRTVQLTDPKNLVWG